MIKQKKIVYLVFVASLFILMQCTSVKRHKTLLRFFDGVPDSSAVVVKPVNTNVVAVVKTDSAVTKSAESKFNLHAPYKDHQCEKCHDQNRIGQLVMPVTELCISCHESFGKKYAFIHGPVSSGYCLKCHSPHMSKNKDLLVNINEKLCYSCHNSEQILQNNSHQVVNVNECTTCHNPHGGKDRYMSN